MGMNSQMSSKIYETRPDNKAKGVLLPVFSLPSKYGIGCFSEEAYRFADWLRDTGHSYWQILPLNPTGCGDSPYQPLSSFAGNAYFIDPQQLLHQKLITQAELDSYDFGETPGCGYTTYVDYEALYDTRMDMLRLAFRRFREQKLERTGLYQRFIDENAVWLDDYALFMALREDFGREESWDDWPDELRHRDAAALRQAADSHREAVEFHIWTQYEFYRQWGALKTYANEAGVKIIGDMPIYVSYDSADCWADPEQFQLDEDLQPTMIAGVPPDAFTDEGQLWGNPLYDWDRMKRDGYDWWVRRIRQSFRLYDVIRLDHFRGFESYYTVEAGAENAINGTWQIGPGIDLFGRLDDVSGEDFVLQDRFVAEDLGFLTEEVHQLLQETGFPGTKVIQFAFDGDPENMYLPENYKVNCVVYTGTHDNDTTPGWFRDLSPEAQAGILQYLGFTAEEAWEMVDPRGNAGGQGAEDGGHGSDNQNDPAIIASERMIGKALGSCAKIAIIPLQDYLCLGSEARTNTPGTVGGNWKWKLARVL